MIGFAVSLTLSLMEQKSPNGLSLTSQFVNRFFSSACTHIQFQAANNWDPVKAAAVGGKSLSLPYSPFPLLPLIFFSRRTRSGPRHESCLINLHGRMRSLPCVHDHCLISTLEVIDRVLYGWCCYFCLFSSTVVSFLVFLVVGIARTPRNVELFFSYGTVTGHRGGRRRTIGFV
jgi:hypothetical protein